METQSSTERGQLQYIKHNHLACKAASTLIVYPIPIVQTILIPNEVKEYCVLKREESKLHQNRSPRNIAADVVKQSIIEEHAVTGQQNDQKQRYLHFIIEFKEFTFLFIQKILETNILIFTLQLLLFI